MRRGVILLCSRGWRWPAPPPPRREIRFRLADLSRETRHFPESCKAHTCGRRAAGRLPTCPPSIFICCACHATAITCAACVAAQTSSTSTTAGRRLTDQPEPCEAAPMNKLSLLPTFRSARDARSRAMPPQRGRRTPRVATGRLEKRAAAPRGRARRAGASCTYSSHVKSHAEHTPRVDVRVRVMKSLIVSSGTASRRWRWGVRVRRDAVLPC
jgi:hypothetical protein